MGFWVYLEDGTIQSHMMGSGTENFEYFGGPISGVRYRYGDVIESLQWIYDSCYCDFSISTPNPLSVLMGTPTTVTLTQPVSAVGTDIFHDSEESCS